jgi:hypothetical protein
MNRPRKHRVMVGRICEAGQHNACPSVGDPYDDEEDDVFVCSCACHDKRTTEETGE